MEKQVYCYCLLIHSREVSQNVSAAKMCSSVISQPVIKGQQYFCMTHCLDLIYNPTEYFQNISKDKRY